MSQRWTIIEWDLYHPLHEELMRLPYLPQRLSLDGVGTPRTLLTLAKLGEALHTALAGSMTMLANPSRGAARFIWLVVDAEIDPEDRVASHEQCGRVAHDPLLMQTVSDAVRAPLRKACANIAVAIREWDHALLNTTLQPGQTAMQLAPTAILVERMKHELEQALQAGVRDMHTVQADAPAAPTLAGEVHRGGKILLYLGLGLAGVGLAIASLVLPPLGVAGIVLGAIGLYRGALDTAKAFVTNLETAGHVRKRLVKSLQSYQGGIHQHGMKTFLTMLGNLTLKTNVVYTVTGFDPLASVADVMDEMKEYQDLVQRMRAQLSGLSESLLEKMDALQRLEREGRLRPVELDLVQLNPQGVKLPPVTLERSKEELALEQLLLKIETRHAAWERELEELTRLRQELAPLAASGGKAAALTEKALESCINATLSVLTLTLDRPDNAREWSELALDVAGQVEPAVGLAKQALPGRAAQPGQVPDRYSA
jgi:hypothetical protein